MRIVFSFAMLLLLTSCAMSYNTQNPTNEKYQEVLDNWLEKDKDELLSVWGKPSYDYMKDDINYVVYMKNKMQPVAQGNKIERMPRMAFDRPFFKEETATVSKGCTTVFIIQDDYIRQWRYEGSACQAY